MKIGDLVLVNLTNMTHMKIGVIIATTTRREPSGTRYGVEAVVQRAARAQGFRAPFLGDCTRPERRAFIVAWATGTTSEVDASRVIPYEGYAGKKHNDIK